MQRSYLVKSSVNFADFGFFVKVGDILVHDPANGNKLTVYRNGAVVRDIKQTSIGLAAFVKNEVIVEVVVPAQTPTAASKASAKPIVESKPTKKPETKAAPAPGVPVGQKEYDKLKESVKKPTGLTAEEFTPAVKRGKAQGKEVPIPDRLREALEIEDESV